MWLPVDRIRSSSYSGTSILISHTWKKVMLLLALQSFQPDCAVRLLTPHSSHNSQWSCTLAATLLHSAGSPHWGPDNTAYSPAPNKTTKNKSCLWACKWNQEELLPVDYMTFCSHYIITYKMTDLKTFSQWMVIHDIKEVLKYYKE